MESVALHVTPEEIPVKVTVPVFVSAATGIATLYAVRSVNFALSQGDRDTLVAVDERVGVREGKRVSSRARHDVRAFVVQAGGAAAFRTRGARF